MSRSLIEQWFPAPTIGAESLRDASAAKKPPNSRLHVWWARRPLTASRAAIVASLLPAWPSDTDLANDPGAERIVDGLRGEFPDGEDEYHAWFLRILGILGDPVHGQKLLRAANDQGIKLEGNGYGYARAFTVSPNEAEVARLTRLAGLRAPLDGAPVILDPFAGGGSIPFEASRFGCTTIASELNPVATAILNATVDLPGRLGTMFADTIQTWGTQWASKVRDQLNPYFPKVYGESVIAYIWATTVPCPTTGRPTPLAPDFWLATGKVGRSVAIAMDVDRAAGTVALRIVEGNRAREHGGRSTYKRGTGVSIWTDETFGGSYIRERALAGELGEMLLAVCVTISERKGRQFRAPTGADAKAVTSANAALSERLPGWEIDDLVPSEAVFEGKETQRSVDMGIFHWRQMFSPRQLLTNVTALEELHEIQHQVADELPKLQAKALALYLALALDKAVDYNGRLSSWHSSRTTVRNTFDRHDFAFKWSFAEFDGAAALLPWAVSQVVDAYSGIAKLAQHPASLSEGEHRASARIIRASATSLDLLDASIDAVITDPPYYDNVMYGECSDYFYVWLKRALRHTWPELCGLTLTDKQEEAVANPSLFKDVATHSGRGKRKPGTVTAVELADQRYEELLTRAFRETHRLLKDDGVMTVMFTHKRVDAWDTLGAALLQAGFVIASSWPVHTESPQSLHQAKKNAASSTILLTCRKRTERGEAYWDDLKNDVARAARDAAHRFSAQGITGVDLTLATYGPALEVLSRRWPVYTGQLGPDGEPELLRPDRALDLAREEAARLKKRDLLGGRTVEFDRLTDYYLLAWSDFRAAEFPSGEALKLSIATHLDLDELISPHRLLKSSGGWVTLLTPAERRTAGGIDTEDFDPPALIDALHTLMLVYDEDGLHAARDWLDRAGLQDDTRFRDLVRSALAAIPRTKEHGEWVRPEARTLEGLRATLFDDIAAPADPDAELLAEMQQQFALDA
jgi:adenine-specific DNA methylase